MADWEIGLEEELEKLDEENSTFIGTHHKGIDFSIDHDINIENGDDDDDEEQLERLPIPLKSKNIESLFGPSVESIWKKKKRKRRTGVTSTSKTLPPAIANLFGQANSKYIAGDYEEALQLFAQITVIAPKHSDAYLSMGIIYEETGNKITAFHYFQLAMKFAPRNCDLLFKVANLAYDLGYHQKSLAIFNRIFLTERSLDVSATRILLYIELSYLKKAQRLLRDTMSKYPTEHSLLLEFGECCYRNYFYSPGIHSIMSYISKSTAYFNSRNPTEASSAPEVEDGQGQGQQMLLFNTCDGLSRACQIILLIYLEIYQTDTGFTLPDQDNPAEINLIDKNLTSEATDALHALFQACVSTLHFYIAHNDILNVICDQSDPTTLNYWRTSIQKLLSTSTEIKFDRIGDLLYLTDEMRLIQIICVLEQTIQEKRKDKHISHEAPDLSSPSPAVASAADQTSRKDKNWFTCLRHLFPILGNISQQEKILSQGLETYLESQRSIANSSSRVPIVGEESESNDVPLPQTEELKSLWLLQYVKIEKQLLNSDSHDDKFEIGEQIPVQNSLTKEEIGTVECRSQNYWKYILYARIHIATLLLSLGMTKKALSLSREVSNCPLLIPSILTSMNIATILKRHCILLITNFMSTLEQNVQHSSELIREILQVCVRVLENNPNDAECLVIFSTFCERFQHDYLTVGITMLSGHLETILTHFHNSKIYYETQLSSTSTASKSPDECEREGDVEGEGEAEAEGEREEEVELEVDDLGKEDNEQEGKEGESLGELESKTSVEENETVNTNQSNRINEIMQESLVENVETIHSLPPPRKNNNPWEIAPHGLDLREIDICLELRALYLWARLSLETQQDIISYCAIVFPLVDCYCQYETEKTMRIKKKKRKNPFKMSHMWKKTEVMNYPTYSWMSETHVELSRMTYAFCLHLTHLHEAFTLQDVWVMIETLSSHQEAISPYIQEYKLDWIYSSGVISKGMSLSSSCSVGDYESFPPPLDLTEEASINVEDIRLIQQKAHKKRKFDHMMLERDGNIRYHAVGTGQGGKSHPNQPVLISNPHILASKEVQNLLRYTVPLPLATSSSSTSTSTSSSSSSSVPATSSATSLIVESNKDLLTTSSTISLLAGKCALKLLTTPTDIHAANLLMKEFNAQGDDYLNYDANSPYERLHLRQFLKSHPTCPFALLLCGHYYSCRHRYALALDQYLDAYYYAPNEPLIALTIAIFLIFISLHSHTPNKQDICLRGMVVFQHYQQLRLQQIQSFQQNSSTSTSSSPQLPSSPPQTQSQSTQQPQQQTLEQQHLFEGNCLQEIYFNLGLLYYQIKSNHLSEYYLKKVLDLEEESLAKHRQSLTLTRDAAFHLILLYREAENENLAIEIMKKYLTF